MAAAPTNTDSNPTGTTDDGLPEQRHAGKVGYGPNYVVGPTLGDKILGLKEQIAGKLTQNPERLSRGRDILSGEERRKKLTGENEPNPFEQAGEDDSAKNEEKPTGVPDTSLSTSVASDRGTTETEEEQGRPKIVDTNHDQT